MPSPSSDKDNQLLSYAASVPFTAQGTAELYVRACGVYGVPVQATPLEKKANLVTLDGNSAAGKDTALDRLVLSGLLNPLSIETVSMKKNPFRAALKKYWSDRELRDDDGFLVAKLLAIGTRFVFENSCAPQLGDETKLLVWNRGPLSSAVCQGATGADQQQVMGLYDFFPKPDAQVILHCEYDVAMQRIAQRSHPPSRFDEPWFIEKTCRRFKELEVPGSVKIDTTSISIEETVRLLAEGISRRLK